MINQHKSICIYTFAIIALFVSACTPEPESATQSEIGVTGLIQHNVYFYLNEEVTDSEKEVFVSNLQEMVNIATIKRSWIGIPAATDSRDVTDHEFSVSLTLWFETVEDHDLYQIDPEHVKMVESSSHLLRGVKVYDSLIFFED